LRIGIVTPSIAINEGQGRVNYEIAAEAVRRGHEVSVFCEHVGPDMAGRGDVWPKQIAAPNWLPTQLLKDQFFALGSLKYVNSGSRRNGVVGGRGFDAILANGFSTWSSTDVNAVHFVHSSWQESRHHPWRQHRTIRSMYYKLYNNLNAVLERGAFRRSRVIVAVSEKVKRELIDIGVPAARITTILNGVDADEFRPGFEDRAPFNLPRDAVIGLFAGDLNDSRKNLDTVLHALAAAPELHLAVAGRHEHTRWEQLASEVGVRDRVHFVGFRRDMPQLMRATDLLVFPSRYEPFGLVILEALASGLPVITTRSAGGAEVVSPESGIVLQDSESVDELSAAMRQLSGSRELRESMGHAGRELALRHSWRAMADQYLRLLEATCGN
jgi:glycosyltransferase involved in cell wall biosynthesis